MSTFIIIKTIFMIASLLSFVSIVLTVMPVSGASSQCTDTAYTRNRDLVYVGKFGLGIESYHLSASGESYTNFEKSTETTDDGKKYPSRKHHVNPKLDIETRTYSGSCHWNEPSTVYGGIFRHDYNFTFSKDWRTMESGRTFLNNLNSSKNRDYPFAKNYYTIFDFAWDYISDGQKLT